MNFETHLPAQSTLPGGKKSGDCSGKGRKGEELSRNFCPVAVLRE